MSLPQIGSRSLRDPPVRLIPQHRLLRTMTHPFTNATRSASTPQPLHQPCLTWYQLRVPPRVEQHEVTAYLGICLFFRDSPPKSPLNTNASSDWNNTAPRFTMLIKNQHHSPQKTSTHTYSCSHSIADPKTPGNRQSQPHESQSL